VGTSAQAMSVFIPVHGLEIADDVGGELRVDDVLFIATKKISRVRKRLGLPQPLSEYRRQFDKIVPLFESASTYALVRGRRDPLDSALVSERRRVQRAICFLASSLFARCDRGRYHIGINPPVSQQLHESGLIFACDNDFARACHMSMTPIEHYRYGAEETAYMKAHFFNHLLSIGTRRSGMKPDWHKSVIRAAELAGRSYLSTSVIDAFMYDMIAIESLLLQPQERHNVVLVERINALFGWRMKHRADGWKDIVDRLYRLRYQYVHSGAGNEINGIDLYNADTLLQNLLRNICLFAPRFTSKNAIIEHAEKVRARKTLGRPALTKQDRFVFSARHVPERDLEKLKRAEWSLD
jgi:hypothetical protein